MGICPTVSAWTEIGRGRTDACEERERKTMGICPTVSAWTEIGGVELMRVKREKDDGHMPYC